ncbi:MAG: hypothetical protein P1U63_02070 [Coxiellaceae bacterium]|nr:hypothetical protein [Coxiellaceae bacterium]
MKSLKQIKKLVLISLLGISVAIAPSLASAHRHYEPRHWHRWQRHHYWRHNRTDPGAVLGLLAIGTVAGVIIGAAANDSHHYRRCWTEIQHHRRVRICHEEYN